MTTTATTEFEAGFRLRQGEELNEKVITPLNNVISQANTLEGQLAGTTAQTVSAGVTAAVGGGQTNATQLKGKGATIATVASAADSVKLPLAVAGATYFLANLGANSAQVFGAGTDTINSVATATGVAQAAAQRALYFAISSAPGGNWIKMVGA